MTNFLIALIVFPTIACFTGFPSSSAAGYDQSSWLSGPWTDVPTESPIIGPADQYDTVFILFIYHLLDQRSADDMFGVHETLSLYISCRLPIAILLTNFG